MAGRLRRRLRSTEHTGDEGPFVSFTDLFIGILFLFLILVAVLMLMHQEAMRKAAQQIAELQAELAAIKKLDADHTPFRLALVYNSYQKPASEKVWTFSRTVQVFRSPDGLCLENIIFRNNLNLAWKPTVKSETIPTAADQKFVRMLTPCTLSASGEHWSSDSETGGVQRAAANLYSGATVLHKTEGDEKIDIQYRILGVYDDYFGKPAVQASPKAPHSNRT
jgi:hypothetical protein